LLCGLPGSGKTTLAKRLASEVPALRVCPDEWKADLGVDFFDEPFRLRLEHRLRMLAMDLLRLGQNVILEFGFWAREERDELRVAGHAVGALVELHYLAVPFDELVRRLDARNSEGEHGTVPITRELLTKYAQIFQAPDDEELNLFDRPMTMIQ
jgi:predicted kinase